MNNITPQIDNFVRVNQLRPADAFVVNKQFFKILDHYVVYLGKSMGNHIFIANYTKGIKILQLNDIAMFLAKYVPVRINRFKGNEFQRNEAIERALSRLDENAYHLIVNNCEHFTNYVQYGTPKSNQVKEAGLSLAVVGAVTGIAGAASKNDNAVIGGILIAGLGLILGSLED